MRLVTAACLSCARFIFLKSPRPNITTAFKSFRIIVELRKKAARK
jgi:hypothetical protein